MAPPRDAFSLQGKPALVSGGSSGTCRAVAIIPAAPGGSPEVNHRSGRDRAEAVVAKIVPDRGPAIAVPADVTDPASVERTFPEVAEQLGPVDVLVDNAGDGVPPCHWSELAGEWRRAVTSCDIQRRWEVLTCQSRVEFL